MSLDIASEDGCIPRAGSSAIGVVATKTSAPFGGVHRIVAGENGISHCASDDNDEEEEGMLYSIPSAVAVRQPTPGRCTADHRVQIGSKSRVGCDAVTGR